ncbi:phosphoribosylglycinamide formyltransferase [Plebeiibacterium marinum]|uniref:Phosphoribosylglycinamide formyltransferase n=1 Tax=Plebeiibacterium marinum TaxID=2992111 RepID=A0AAE3M9W2_9BACT|nr:phosphoribosylglycinamide formyltransferase [Plebeiobacterium marinum]MCW3803988.1 phosphoribosylglycinamide formyltransferase [Plebeiobacterium marinum]
MSKVAIFASGSGSNAENIVNFFKGKSFNTEFRFFTNKKDAFVNQRAKKLGINITVFDKNEFYNTDKVLNELIVGEYDIVVLAGFLWLIPEGLVKAFKGRIVNIHPALLPKYGGKGMYGKKVHEAVVANSDSETGITIHMVDERYDEGKVLFQKACKVDKGDSAEDVEQKVHALEYKYYPVVIEKLLNDLL